MCGFVGFINTRKGTNDYRCVLQQMAGMLKHRGPDDQGVWYDNAAGIGLAHRRLSILDLSPEGHQPMISASGRYVIAYNGEIYNCKNIQEDLEGIGFTFRGTSDTEVLLSAIEAWGLEKSLSRFIGMFAFSLWDRHERKLRLVRDRLGIKPIYYGEVNGSFVFVSELKALKAYPGFDNPINRDAIALFLRHNYIPAPYSIYRNIKKLEPGQILALEINKGGGFEYRYHVYWSALTAAEQGLNVPFKGGKEEAIVKLDELLRDAVGLRMLSDVPLGAFLSGGIDSSLVVALMQEQSSEPVKTFSIGFHEAKYNEAVYAKSVAQHLGTDHTELYVSPEDAMAVVPKLPTLFDEPFSDPSQIPTFLVSQLARNNVTVSLSGDGGDELFYGYDRYFFTQRIWQRVRWMPKSMRTAISRVLSSALPESWNTTRLISEVLSMGGPDDLYKRITSHWKDPGDVVIGASNPVTTLADLSLQAKLPDFMNRMMFFDLIGYLPDDILVKVDRASMGVSLEARVPILDHRVVEFAWCLPLKLKVHQDVGKWILRQVLYKYVPKELVERPKMGFGVPIDAWLRGPLRDWAEALINESRLRNEGYLKPSHIRSKWHEHLQGQKQWHYYLWDVLMFQSWLEQCNSH